MKNSDYYMPEGWVAVPIEMTEKMIEAGWEAYRLGANFPEVWLFILSAVPSRSEVKDD